VGLLGSAGHDVHIKIPPLHCRLQHKHLNLLTLSLIPAVVFPEYFTDPLSLLFGISGLGALQRLVCPGISPGCMTVLKAILMFLRTYQNHMESFIAAL
jgi:hypothetical protein